MSAKKNIIPIFVPHYGCPHDCVFCNQRLISGVKTPLSPHAVARQIQKGLELIPPGGKVEIAFYGGSFTAIPKKEQEALLQVAESFVHKGDVHDIRVSTRPDAIDEDVLARLRRYGVRTIEIGAQSMLDEVLASSGRGHRALDVIRASAMIKTAGFKLILQMMTGLPGGSFEGDVFTANSICTLKPDGVRIYPTVIIKDTALHGMWLRGDYIEHTVEDAVKICAELVPIFEKAGIPVIRLGLNASDELSEGSAVAGAYHPALGELVRSRIMLIKAREALRGVARNSRVTLGVSQSRVSPMIGQHRDNINILMREFRLKEINVRAVDVEPGRIVVLAAVRE